ncbi:MAG TPA: BamA/TamA family outer membrane protein [Anaeromyxobacteraceae bacterium]|nr:BamA/TamA family outer membrane protein [Anaeromyxobacteraceae bacterium]
MPHRTALALLLAALAAPSLAAEAEPKPAPPAGARAPPAAPPAGPAEADEPVTVVDLTLPEYLGHAVGLRPLPVPGRAQDERFHWTVLPFVVLNPLMGGGGGAATIAGFRLGPRETTRFSSLEASAFLTERGQRGISLRSDVRFPDDDWNLVGDLGAGQFPNPAWGLGAATPESARVVVHRTQVTVHETLYRRLASRLYAGLGYAFDDFHAIAPDGPILDPSGQPYPVGTSGRSITSSLALHLLWDDRDSPAAPTRGSYLMARLRSSHSLLGADDEWRSLYLDARTYLRVPGPRAVLALWGVAWSAFGRPPYLLLPSIGADPDHRTGRGLVEGRYTGKDLAYAEAEYRFHLWEFLSAAVGASATAVSDRSPETPRAGFGAVHPSFVVGVRALLSSASQARLAFDVALSPGRGVAFYLAANEAF